VLPRWLDYHHAEITLPWRDVIGRNVKGLGLHNLWSSKE